MQFQFQIFPNYLIMPLQFFFLPELILHKYSVEGYGTTRRLAREVQQQVQATSRLTRRARWWSALGHNADFRHNGLDACDSVQETLCSIPSMRRADKIVPLNSRNTKFSVKTCPHAMVLLVFRASHLETPTAHSSHHCPKLRENATRKSVTKVEIRKREKKKGNGREGEKKENE